MTEYTDNLIPDMTGYTSPSGEASASSEASGRFAWHAFDQDTSTFWAQSGTGDCWVKYQFETAKTIAKYTMTARPSNPQYSPKNWTFQGSNNDSDWTTLDTATDETGWTASEKREFTFSNSTSYTYYRIYITAPVDSFSSIAELEMMEEESAFKSGVSFGSANMMVV